MFLPGLAICDRALDFKLQFSRALEIGSSDSPSFVSWWFESDRAPFKHCSEIAIAIITLKSDGCRNIIIGRVENEGHGVK